MKKMILLFPILLLILVSCENKIEKNSVTMHYDSETPKEDAEKVLDFMIEEGFADGKQKDIKLEKKEDEYIFKMVTSNTVNIDEELTYISEELACMMSQKLFGNKKVTYVFTDDQWNLIKETNSLACDKFNMLNKEVKKIGLTEIYYPKGFDSKILEDVSNYLETSLADSEKRERTFAVNKVGEALEFMMVVDESIYNSSSEPGEEFSALACELILATGLETQVYLCNNLMVKKKDVYCKY